MSDDEDFRPRIGKPRAKGTPGARKYLHRVLAAAMLAGGLRRPGGRRRFDGSRIGRGAAAARLLGSRDRFAGLRGRRAVVKSRLVRLGGKGLAAARAHLRYIQRDGVTREGTAGSLYGRDTDLADGKAFLERSEGDRHQFRFILSAEDGAEYSDLRPLVRRFMAQLEEDLGTSLDWVAADHLDTGHPHSHVIFRGRDDQCENLVIARDYIGQGMRERLAELVTLDLGPRTDVEIRRNLGLEVQAERLTSINRQLLREAGTGLEVGAGHADPFRHALRTGRLRKLESLGLASPAGSSRWRLSDRLEERLRAMGEQGDIIRTMQRELKRSGLQRSLGDAVVHDREKLGAPIVGRVVARGLSDELRDRHYLIIDAVDGRVHHVDIGAGGEIEPLGHGAVVRLARAETGIRPSDHLVAEIAAANDGVYSGEAHRRRDPSASPDFIQAHVRRPEALRRAGVGVERAADGTWTIPKDFLERAASAKERGALRRPVEVELLSPIPLRQLATAEGATWLDRELLADKPEPLRDAGFGQEVRSALAVRRQWLLDAQLAGGDPEAPTYPRNMLATLRQRELIWAARQLGEELGLSYAEAEPGMRFAGRVERRVDLASGRFALVANSREFSLVPWRPGLERHLGRELELRLSGSGPTWTFGRGRGGPEVG